MHFVFLIFSLICNQLRVLHFSTINEYLLSSNSNLTSLPALRVIRTRRFHPLFALLQFSLSFSLPFTVSLTFSFLLSSFILLPLSLSLCLFPSLFLSIFPRSHFRSTNYIFASRCICVARTTRIALKVINYLMNLIIKARMHLHLFFSLSSSSLNCFVD